MTSKPYDIKIGIAAALVALLALSLCCIAPVLGVDPALSLEEISRLSENSYTAPNYTFYPDSIYTEVYPDSIYTESFKTKAFTQDHTTEKDGYYYLNEHLNISMVESYITAHIDYFVQNPHTQVIINIAGHGWFSNNEVIAESHDDRIISPSVYAGLYPNDRIIWAIFGTNRNRIITYDVHQEVIDRLYYEIKYSDLNWIGVYNPALKNPLNKGIGILSDKWVNVVWGQSYLP